MLMSYERKLPDFNYAFVSAVVLSFSSPVILFCILSKYVFCVLIESKKNLRGVENPTEENKYREYTLAQIFMMQGES